MHLSIFAILCATATGIVVANIWYYPSIFGKIWFKQLSEYLRDPQAAIDRNKKIYGFYYIYLLFVSIFLGESIHLYSSLIGGIGF